MSLLAALAKKKASLEPTRTLVTDAQGRKFWRVVAEDGSERLTPSEESSSSGFVVDTAPDEKLAFVVEGLFVGSQDAANNLSALRESKVSHVLNLVSGIQPAFPEVWCID